MFLKDFPGQDDLKAYFSKIVTEDRVPHALLMVGGEGHGQLQLSIGLAILLQCHDNASGEACGKCPSCFKAKQLIHPDIHFSFPVIKKDGLKRDETTSQHFMEEWRGFVQNHPYGNINDWMNHLGASDKSPNINVAECHHINKNLGLKTYEGKYKVQIIWAGAFLGKEGNRLLKLIEEPTPNTIIILIENNRNAILNTIRSRCQIINVPPFTDEIISETVSAGGQLSDEDQQELTYLADGDMRKVHQLIEQTEMNFSEDILNWFRIAYKSDPDDIFQFVDYLLGNGKQEIRNFFSYGLHFLREYHLGIITGDIDMLRLTATEKEVAGKMQKIIDGPKTEALEKLLSKAVTYVNRNLSLKILLTNMTLEIHNVLRSKVNEMITN